MKKRIIIDTNWWIAFIVSKITGQLPEVLATRKVDVYFSETLLDEIKKTLTYERIANRINIENLQSFLNLIKESVVFVKSTSVVGICRDPKDNFLLALSKDADADFLITNDIDLLSIKKFENTSIVTLNEFIQLSKQ